MLSTNVTERAATVRRERRSGRGEATYGAFVTPWAGVPPCLYSHFETWRKSISEQKM